jgi:FkbM family methyltransferase
VQIVDRLAKPEYIYRPTQVLRRFRVRGQHSPVIRLPWGANLAVTATEAIGSGIARTGVHELAVTEAIFRLLAPGDLALDVGANIGYFTSLMASRVGNGSVIAFEPHPTLHGRLVENVARWETAHRVTVDRRAVSDAVGVAHLNVADDFTSNMGTSSLGEPSAASIAVETITLDAVLEGRRAGLLKLDVEGNELAALTGATLALEQRMIGHVIFEEHDALPTPVSALLVDAGFAVYGLREELRGIELVRPDRFRPRWDAPTYLATTGVSLLAGRGWQSLRRPTRPSG